MSNEPPVRGKSYNDIEAQLERIYSRTGGPYSGNPRRIAADRIGYRYLSNIQDAQENTMRRIGRLASEGRIDEARALVARARNRRFSRSVYAR